MDYYEAEISLEELEEILFAETVPAPDGPQATGRDSDPGHSVQ